jgi:hypothetical protein
MAKLSDEQENVWQTQATAAAVAEARAIAKSQLANVPADALDDRQMGWVVVAALFGWIKTRYQQAVAEGLDREGHVARMNPSPRDSAVVGSILSRLADQARIDWSKPLASWSKQEMTGFIELAMHLIDEAKGALKDDGFPEIPAFLKGSQGKPPAESKLNDRIPF